MSISVGTNFWAYTGKNQLSKPLKTVLLVLYAVEWELINSINCIVSSTPTDGQCSYNSRQTRGVFRGPSPVFGLETKFVLIFNVKKTIYAKIWTRLKMYTYYVPPPPADLTRHCVRQQLSPQYWNKPTCTRIHYACIHYYTVVSKMCTFLPREA